MKEMPIDWNSVLACPEVQQLIRIAIAEDVGNADLTTQAIFRSARQTRARIVTRTPTVTCGMPMALHTLQVFDPSATMAFATADGDRLEAGATLAELEADIRALLKAERIMLNFLMRLCGVAHNARQAVDALPAGSRARIYDTRKTTPGWRALDKAAVRAGGAHNHRMGLYDAVLIKDNHIAAAGSVSEATRRVRERVGPQITVEVEIDDLDQLEPAITAGADIILCDNFANADLVRAVEQTNRRVEVEASGGITLERIAEIARTGVDRISLGSITHTLRPPDLSLELDGGYHP